MMDDQVPIVAEGANGGRMKFFLGTHQPHWLWSGEFHNVPLFVSARRLRQRVRVQKATTEWALDSGGFTELNLYGRWQTTPRQYIDEARRWVEEIGNMAWAAPQDWMCEPFVISRTGLSVREHQLKTTDNFLHLRDAAPDVPFIPVLQGYEFSDYISHVRMYQKFGVSLETQRVVGVGSVCRRQGTQVAEDVLTALFQKGIKTHAFGFKVRGLSRCADVVHSADSLAWSLDARRSAPLPGCQHKTCSSCVRFAKAWLARINRLLCRPRQMKFAYELSEVD